VKADAIWHLRALAADMGWRVLDGDEESIYGYSQHNGVSRILRVASELGEAIEGKSTAYSMLLSNTDNIPDICPEAFIEPQCHSAPLHYPSDDIRQTLTAY
jgi:hypothetical protein